MNSADLIINDVVIRFDKKRCHANQVWLSINNTWLFFLRLQLTRRLKTTPPLRWKVSSPLAKTRKNVKRSFSSSASLLTVTTEQWEKYGWRFLTSRRRERWLIVRVSYIQYLALRLGCTWLFSPLIHLQNSSLLDELTEVCFEYKNLDNTEFEVFVAIILIP